MTSPETPPQGDLQTATPETPPQDDEPQDDEPRYVLITECLQNDFVLNAQCRLALPEAVARSVLLGRESARVTASKGIRRFPAEAVEDGPFGQFLDETIGSRMRGEESRGVLHVINIRDWHEPDDNYDFERRRYGTHCEAGTWGSGYVDGLKQWLDPADPLPDTGEARYFEKGSVRIHHVHADSIFDFRPRRTHINTEERKFRASALEILIDVIAQGSDADQKRAQEYLRDDPRPRALWPLAEEIDDDENVRSSGRLYVAVIGFYTDIKVGIVLTGLRTRYELPNLAVSDTFTASTTLERHLSGLDFASKLLDVEVLHGIGNLTRFLGSPGRQRDEAAIVAADSFSRYQNYFLDRQNVLAHESEKLREYEDLTERRSIGVYDTIRRANQFLIVWGMVFLSATLVLSILSAFGVVRWELAAVTGGLSLVQFVGAFFTQPSSDLQRNLTNLAVLKMILESHSLKTAIARFHLTTPQALRELQTEGEADDAGRQVETLQKELKAIEDVDRADFAALERLGFGRDGHATAGTADPGASTANGATDAGSADTEQPAEPAAAPTNDPA
jgi:hypothetical protein